MLFLSFFLLFSSHLYYSPYASTQLNYLIYRYFTFPRKSFDCTSGKWALWRNTETKVRLAYYFFYFFYFYFFYFYYHCKFYSHTSTLPLIYTSTSYLRKTTEVGYKMSCLYNDRDDASLTEVRIALKFHLMLLGFLDYSLVFMLLFISFLLLSFPMYWRVRIYTTLSSTCKKRTRWYRYNTK